MDSLKPDSKVRAVIFDLDGVLTDSEPLINAAAIAMFKERRLEVQPADFLPFVGTGEDLYIGGVAEKYRFPLDLLAAKKRTYEIYLDLVPSQLQVFPGAPDLVRACHSARLLVAVASSADRIKVAANLEKIGLPAHTWDAVVTGEDVTARKPAPDIFLLAAARLGVAPNECAVVEDAVNGVQAAKASGMWCVAVAQTFPADRLQAADLVREKIAEVSLEDLCGGRLTISPEAKVPPLPKSEPSPQAAVPHRTATPWGFWPTLGLSAAVAVSFLVAQIVVAIIWAVVGSISHRGHLPTGWESS